jgi:hypothetical protein
MGTGQGASERIVFQVEVEAGADPISGLLRLDDRELEFAGWIGLAGALERILGPSGSGTNNSKENSQS